MDKYKEKLGSILTRRKLELLKKFASSKILFDFHQKAGCENFFPDIYDTIFYLGTLQLYLNSPVRNDEIYHNWWKYNLFRKSKLFPPITKYKLMRPEWEMEVAVQEEKRIFLEIIKEENIDIYNSDDFQKECENLFSNQKPNIEKVRLFLDKEEFCLPNDEFNTLRISNVHGYILDEESCFLYLLAKHCKLNEPIIEIGSLAGKSTIALGLGVKYSDKFRKVYAIDEWKHSNIYKLFINNIKEYGLDNIIVPIQSLSADALSKISNHKFSLFFIDADHQYESIKNDYSSFEDKIVSGGHIVFHDHYDVFPDIMRLVSEVKNDWIFPQEILSLICMQKP